MSHPSFVQTRARRLAVAVAVIGLAFAGRTAQGPFAQAPAGRAQQAMDPDFAQAVKQWTTRPEFLSPLVDHLPKVAGIPSPKDVLGHHVGAPKKLTSYEEAVGYYRALAAKTPRVRVLTIGKTNEGRDYVLVVVASDETMAGLDRYKAYTAALADPRKTDEAAAKPIVAQAKPIYHLMGGLHSAETGPPEMLMELTYRLAVSDEAMIKKIRDNVIVLITPVAEPDGRDRYVDWYYRHLIDNTDDSVRLPGPPFWGKYVYHDNNRDINFAMPEMSAILKNYFDWHTTVMHDLHESVPYLYIYSGRNPQNPTHDPILWGELPWMANYEMLQLTKYGLPGVWTHSFMDGWFPGYLAWVATDHNGIGRFYETFGNGGATTMKRTLDRNDTGRPRPDQFPTETSREWYRPNPPYKEAEWSIRNNTNYMETAVLSILSLVANNRETFLENFYRKSRNAVDRGVNETPHGWIIPANPSDPTRAAEVVNILLKQGVEVRRVSSELKLKEGTFPAGSYVVRFDQPYRNIAKILLEVQKLPGDTTLTYDDTGWTLGMMHQIDTRAIDDTAILQINDPPLTAPVKAAGTVAGPASAPVLLVAHNGARSLISLRYRLKGAPVLAAEEPFKADDQTFPAGSFIINGGAVADARKAVEDLGLVARGVAEPPKVKSHEVDAPRVAVFSTWGSTQDVGWVRFTFDTLGVPYDLIFKERVLKGNLRGDYDVLLIPDQGRGTGRAIVTDVDAVGRPIDYKKSAQFKSLGQYGESDDITGGMGVEGVVEIDRFVRAGGTLIALGRAAGIPAEYGLLPALEASRPGPQFYAPGPIVKTEIGDPKSPIFYGYTGKDMPVWYSGGPLLSVPARNDKQVLMRYTGGDEGVLSGLVRNPQELRRRVAAFAAPAGRGCIVLFAFNPLYRWQTQAEFNLVFNAMMNYNDLGGAREETKTTSAPAPQP